MQGLGLADAQHASVNQLEEALKNSLRAQRLLDNPDGQWWIDRHEVAVSRLTAKMVTASDEAAIRSHQGGVRAIKRIVDELRYLAMQRADLEEQLNERRKDRTG
jgi:hypothetical protein